MHIPGSVQVALLGSSPLAAGYRFTIQSVGMPGRDVRYQRWLNEQ